MSFYYRSSTTVCHCHTDGKARGAHTVLSYNVTATTGMGSTRGMSPGRYELAM